MSRKPKKTFTFKDLAEYGIEKFEIVSLQNKTLKCNFTLDDVSILKDSYKFQYKLFSITDNKVMDNYRSQHQSCKEINNITVLFTEVVKLIVTFYPEDSYSQEYELEISYDDILKLMKNNHKYEDQYIEIKKINAKLISRDGEIFNNSKKGHLYIDLVLSRKHYNARHYKIKYNNKEIKKGEILANVDQPYSICCLINDSNLSYNFKVTVIIIQKDNNGHEKELTKQEYMLKDILISKPDQSASNTGVHSEGENAALERSMPMGPQAPQSSANQKEVTRNQQGKKQGKKTISNDQQTNQIELQKIINELKINYQDLLADHNQLKEKFNTLQADYNTQKNYNQNVDSQNEKVESLSNQLNEQKDINKKAINDLKDQIEELKKRLTPESMTTDLLKTDNSFSIKLKNLTRKAIENSSHTSNIQYELKKNEIRAKIKAIPFTPVSLSETIRNDLDEFIQIIDDFDTLYPDTESTEEINQSIKNLCFAINKFYVQCTGIQTDRFIEKNFSDISEPEDLDKAFKNAVKQLNKIEQFIATRSFSTEKEVVQKITEFSEHIFRLIKKYRKEIFQWHIENIESYYSRTVDELEHLINNIYKKAGIFEIAAEVGQEYNTDLHTEYEKNRDFSKPDKAIIKILKPGYQIKWINKIIEKTNVAVNYRH